MSLKLADIFTNHMVLQRNSAIPIWGTSDKSPIRISFCDEVVEVTGGTWLTTLSPREAGGPYELKVTDGQETITLQDVFIGDVFIAGGQSNMEFELQRTLNGEEEVKNANHPLIRYYQVPKIEFEDPTHKPKSHWTICSKETAGLYSAVAYYFAKHLNQNIPIGLIGCNWGGTSASCWMSRESLEKNEDIRIYLDEYEEEVKKYVSIDAYEEKRQAYLKSQHDHWLKYCQFKEENPDVPEQLVSSHIGDWPWPPPVGPKSFLRPVGLYATMLKKITPFAIKAVLWYQGESDTHRPLLYTKLLGTMIDCWREDFNQKDLPFLIVQLPGYGNGNPHHLEYAYLREAQEKVTKQKSNTYLMVSIDCGEREDIHPIHKEPIGTRLALLARAKLYHESLIYSGPTFKEFKVEGDKIILTFNQIGDGLVVKGDTLKGFKLCGKDHVFTDCEAYLEGDSVVLINHKPNEPIYVRYGFENDPEGNLYNKNGFPLCPFRRDIL